MNVAVMGCRNIKDETCIGCQRCLTAFDCKEGAFARYKDVPDAKLIALFHCGGCPATSPVLRMVQLRDWMAGMGEKVDALHVATCVMNHCAYKDELLATVKKKAGIEIVEGSHPYVPQNVYGA